MSVYRILVTKKNDKSFSVSYDIEGVNPEKYLTTIFAEPAVDDYELINNSYSYPKFSFRIALHDGQFDQRAAAVLDLLKINNPEAEVWVRVSKIFYASGIEEMEYLKKQNINPVDTTELPLEIPVTLKKEYRRAESESEFSVAMSTEDFDYLTNYFENTLGRKPTETEIRVLDTYWSDHCRHTTFNTYLTDISFDEGLCSIESAYAKFLEYKSKLGREAKPTTLMEIATINSRILKSQGLLADLDTSDEINACSVVRNVLTEKGNEEYLIMFKNETHNHPTEIEPYGGAATCVGGAIRDPLSGRSYVYNSVRVTGAASSKKPPLDEKLPQKVICREAARGFSSYGNQIGIATGLVDEIYHDGYVAKRLEIGAVIGAVPKNQVRREKPQNGDLVILLGGATGRDGIGGATGSSKEHKTESTKTASAEVQKGNAPEERKLQRLFRNPEFAGYIKKCNDFGAGGVCVAVGELADSIEIWLEKVPLKYNGLTPTEIAISESQERMAIVIDAKDEASVKKLSNLENVEATVIAKITDTGLLEMKYDGDTVFSVPRDFIETSGISRMQNVRIKSKYDEEINSLDELDKNNNIKLLEALSGQRDASRKGLIDLFDNSIGSGTVLMPFGGKRLASPSQVACCRIPNTKDDASLLTYGFHPGGHPFVMAQLSILESVAKIIAAGGNLENIRLSLQEYFPKLREDEGRWGAPLAALLGAFVVQEGLGLAAIGGKDSMSGSYENLDVPSTLVSFAMNTQKIEKIITTDLKSTDSNIWLLNVEIPTVAAEYDYGNVKYGYERLAEYAEQGRVRSMFAVGAGGIAPAIAKMAFGNAVGVNLRVSEAYSPLQGSILIETDKQTDLSGFARLVGETTAASLIIINGDECPLDIAHKSYNEGLSSIYDIVESVEHSTSTSIKERKILSDYEPKVAMLIFPGTNSEDDMGAAFKKAGAQVREIVFRNLTKSDVERSVKEMADAISDCDICVVPGGFSAADEPDGSGKYIATVLRKESIKNEIHNLLDRQGLILGVCNGFQALVKTGLLPFGKVHDDMTGLPTLTHNKQGRHIARVTPVEIVSSKSPWLSYNEVGDTVMTAMSHGEGRFFADEELVKKLEENGQIATKYAEKGFNGSVADIEGMISPDGLILGKMGHIERVHEGIYKNVYGSFDHRIIEAGVDYIKRKNI